MSDGFEFTLHSPLTKEDWDKITDVEHENTMAITFQTPQGRQARYIKYEALDKIRAEIEQMPSELTNDGRRMIRRESVFRIIDKYKGERG